METFADFETLDEAKTAEKEGLVTNVVERMRGEVGSYVDRGTINYSKKEWTGKVTEKGLVEAARLKKLSKRKFS